jgi:hypothetical protein
MPERRGRAIADVIAERLAEYLGENTSRIAVKTFAIKALGRGPETLTPDDVPILCDALLPMLRTFVGRAHAEVMLMQINEDLGR